MLSYEGTSSSSSQIALSEAIVVGGKSEGSRLALRKRTMLLKKAYTGKIPKSTKLQNAPGATSRDKLNLKTSPYRS